MERGSQLYEGLTNADKARITHKMTDKVENTPEGEAWTRFVEQSVEAIIARRASHDEPLDQSSIVAELVPLVRAHLPETVREVAFRHIAQMALA